MNHQDTIAAVATGVGGALAVIRVSGKQAIDICNRTFRARSGKSLNEAAGYTLHYGDITDSCNEVIDDVVLSLFRAPRSYTGEDMVEISCHASQYIQGRILRTLISLGARSAEPGEFTIRAFLAGKLDLSQAEAVADMIASTDRATHALATNQMRGGYSSEFTALREQLIELVSLLELELDFGEEDVEFADRTKLAGLVERVQERVTSLLDSFTLGNAIKEGVAVAIVGSPNVGKSTLLNTLLCEERAMVSDIAGTTRDVIEESLNINGIRFRFIDTAGIRETSDKLEQMGIERTFSSILRARIVILLVEASSASADSVRDCIASLTLRNDQKLCVVINKIDKLEGLELDPLPDSPLQTMLKSIHATTPNTPIIAISAKIGTGIQRLREFLAADVSADPIYHGNTVVSNARHYEALQGAKSSLERAGAAMQTNLPADLLSQDLQETLHHLGLITGEITTNDILASIFSKFCIGK